MKTHIIISGHARTFAHCWPNIRWNVVKRLSNPVFHASLHPDAEGVHLVQTLEAEGYEVRHEYVEQPETWPDYGDAHKHAPYAISVPVSAVLGQLWRMERAWMFARANVSHGDTIVRLRPDLWFHKPISVVQSCFGHCVQFPWWGNFGGMNDRFAVMDTAAAMEYFTAYSAIPQAIKEGCPLHPESLLAHACRDVEKIKADFLFSTIRPSGQQRWPEILPGETPPQ